MTALDERPPEALADRQAVTVSPLKSATRRALGEWPVRLSLFWLLIVVVATALSRVIAPDNPIRQDIGRTFALPSAHHLLGTDGLGRDLLSRLLYGGSSILLGALEATVVGMLIGVPVGLLVGYVGGRIDLLAAFAVNVLLAVPGFVVVITVAFITKNNVAAIMGAFGILVSAGVIRLVRSATLAARDLLYVDAARVAGLSRPRILIRHILPNVSGPLVVQAFYTFSSSFVVLASLSFLGLGFSPEKASWGQMVFDATQNLNGHPWLMVPVGLVLILTVLTLNLLGSQIREALPHAQKPSQLMSARRAVVRAPARSTPERLEDLPMPTDSADPGEVLLSVEGLEVSFPDDSDTDNGEVIVVSGVTFPVRTGRTLALVGESGCGKTMTALAIAGLVPISGRVRATHLRLDGAELNDLSERDRARLRGSSIGLVSQEPMVALDPCYTVGSFLRETLRIHRGLRRAAAKAEALALLRQVGIANPDQVAQRYPHQLSGGMAQRVAIALALTGRPRLLIADEPTTALDVTVQAEILDLLRQIQADLGTTIVLVTHDLGVVADLCDEVGVMYAGQIVEFGSVEQVLLHPTHPYTRGLIGATPDLAATGEHLPTVSGRVPAPKDWKTWCRFMDRCPIAADQCRIDAIPLVESGVGQAVRCIRANEAVI